MDLDTLRLIILLVRERYEQTGDYPTPAQLRTALLEGGR